MIKDIQFRLSEIGKIKLGKKSEQKKKTAGGKEYQLPEKTDYFRITKNVRGADGNLEDDIELMSKFPNNKPTELGVLFLWDDIDRIFRTSYALYAGKRCACRGDGETANRLSKENGKGDTYKDEKVNCPCEYLEGAELEGKKLKCKPTGLLSCILEIAERVGGVYVFRTHSWHSVRNILSSLAFIRELTGGILAGIPLKLTVKPKSVNVKDTGKTQVVYVANIEYPGSLQELRHKAIETAKIRSSSQIELLKYQQQIDKYLLPPESADEQEEVNAEFAPETIEIEEPFENKDNKPVDEKKEPEKPFDKEESLKIDQREAEKQQEKEQIEIIKKPGKDKQQNLF